jgi:sucrose synthase
VIVLTRLIPEAEGTSCNQRLEPIAGTRNAAHPARALPQRRRRGDAALDLAFRIWPYLERYALDAERDCWRSSAAGRT